MPDLNEKYILHGPPPLIPIENGTAGQQLYEALLKFIHLPEAMIDAHTNRSISYKNLLETTCRLAQSLARCGFTKGSAISVCSENSLQFYYPVIAALYLGIVVAPLNENYTEREILNAVEISKPSLVFCSKNSVQKIRNLQKKFPLIKKIVVLDAEEDLNEAQSLINFIELNSDKNLDVRNFKPIDFDCNDQVGAILCSSGTTGLPKGVMITHMNLAVRFAHAKDPIIGSQIIPAINVLSFLPFFHGYGFLTNLGYFVLGLRIVMIQKFEGDLFLKTIQDYKIKSIMVVPPIMVFLAKSPLVNKYDLTSLTEIICGAAPLGKEVGDAVTKRLKLSGIRQGYGLTEMTLGVIITPNNAFISGSSGKVLPYITTKVIDPETGKSLGPGKEGELCFKGPLMMKGYAGNEKATREAIDQSGWLHSGDIGYYNEEGHFFIVDRLKELIKYKGFQVPPAELEALLLQHPKIKDAAVIGIPDDLAGELPAAFVVKQPGAKLTEKEVEKFVADQVSSAKRLRGGVRFLDEIPKNPSGKILRRQLRELVKMQKSKL